MSPERPEVADVIRDYAQHGGALDRFSGQEQRVLRDLVRCRTAALGGHKRVCDRCAHEQIAYNSCRNRHCPKCQAMARRSWLEARAADLLEVGYFHVIFTLPHELSPLARLNRRVVYGLFFRAVSRTLLQVARDPKHLGAQIGFLAVLHTWGQRLHHHPHIHCVVPGGGLSADGTQWIPCRPGFFLPVKVLSRLVRGKMLAYLQRAMETQQLRSVQAHADAAAWRRHLSCLAQKEWVVYAKPPFGGPRQVLKYLARYTHRVAIANTRILAVEDGRVSFRWKDYADQGIEKTMTLDTAAFVRRFLWHVMPSGFVHIRHYGWLANRVRREKLPRCRRLLAMASGRKQEEQAAGEDRTDASETVTEKIANRCPACRAGRMIIAVRLPRDPPGRSGGYLSPEGHDTS